MLLEPGLTMYLPTGTPHAARARDTVSLHVTIGINQLTWRVLLDRAVRRALDGLDADAHLPAGHLDHPALLAEGLASRLGALARALGDLDPADLADEQVAAFLQARNTPLRGAMVDRMALADIDVDTRLQRRPGKPCVLQPDGDRLNLLLGDRRVSVPARITAAVEHVRDLGELTPADLPLDERSSLVLCRDDCVREGLSRGRPLSPRGPEVGDFRCSVASEQRGDDLGRHGHQRPRLRARRAPRPVGCQRPARQPAARRGQGSTSAVTGASRC